MMTFTNRELYDLVWAKPMTLIAAEFGIEAVHFAHACDENHIPRPSPGYWQKLQFGKPVERPGLDQKVATITELVNIKKIKR